MNDAKTVRIRTETVDSTHNVRLVKITPQFDLRGLQPSLAVEKMMAGASEQLRQAFELACKRAIASDR